MSDNTPWLTPQWAVGYLEEVALQFDGRAKDGRAGEAVRLLADECESLRLSVERGNERLIRMTARAEAAEARVRRLEDGLRLIHREATQHHQWWSQDKARALLAGSEAEPDEDEEFICPGGLTDCNGDDSCDCERETDGVTFHESSDTGLTATERRMLYGGGGAK